MKVPIFNSTATAISAIKAVKPSTQEIPTARCRARRRSVRYEDEDEGDREEEYGHNLEIAMLESYSQSAIGEALLVHAIVDEQEVEVLIFKLGPRYFRFEDIYIAHVSISEPTWTPILR
ncbi:hypothetical protein OIU76_013900 [Salix suchowensis]|nr:hypothetical protein OIU76_013900 [Salix suchowensis]